MEFNILYEDENVLVLDKPAGIVVFPEKVGEEKTLIDHLLEKFSSLKNTGQTPRYGIVHRLDKDTSGILLIAKNNQTLDFLQKQFQSGKVVKKYLALVAGTISSDAGVVESLIGRSPRDKRKQKVYLLGDPEVQRKKLRKAITEYKVLQKFKNYTLIEASPKTGRKHQIRAHFSYLSHPIAGDKLYSFKDQVSPKGLLRQFLHANYLKIELPDGEMKEFFSDLPQDLKNVLNNLNSVR
jgi:23S rRNA pseudouridine1911/1915/1917 synthase